MYPVTAARAAIKRATNKGSKIKMRLIIIGSQPTIDSLFGSGYKERVTDGLKGDVTVHETESLGRVQGQRDGGGIIEELDD